MKDKYGMIKLIKYIYEWICKFLQGFAGAGVGKGYGIVSVRGIISAILCY